MKVIRWVMSKSLPVKSVHVPGTDPCGCLVCVGSCLSVSVRLIVPPLKRQSRSCLFPIKPCTVPSKGPSPL